MNKESCFNNRAKNIDNQFTDVTNCDTCNETLVFAMKDNYHEFSIGLRTILECLAIAEKEGYVPPLPPEWWWSLH